MKSILVVDHSLYGRQCSLINEDLLPGKNSDVVLLERLKDLPEISGSFFLGSENDFSVLFKDHGFSFFERSSESGLPGLLMCLKELAFQEKADHVFLVYRDSPLLDTEICKKIIELHLENAAEYSFADNCPDGLSLEALSKEFLEEIVKSASKEPELASRSLFHNLDADINQFYVEVYLPEEDISLRRLQFRMNSRRNTDLIRAFLTEGGPGTGFSTIVNLLKDKPEILFQFPRYVEVEITGRTNGKYALGPGSTGREDTDMSFEDFEKIVKELAEMSDDVILSLGLYGEPLLHAKVCEMIQTALDAGIYSVILETDGIMLQGDLAEKISSFSPDKLQVIVKLDAVQEETYKKLTGRDLRPVMDSVENFLGLNEQNRLRTFVQFVKSEDNLDELESFYRYWESKKAGVIIQKTNDLAGQLDLKRVSDLTPLDRIPCWHLQRDMVIFANGDVPVCKQDYKAEKKTGNAFKDSLKDVRRAQLSFFLDNYLSVYKENPLCSECDEWYTYNF